MADRVTNRGNNTRNKNEHKRLTAKVREGEQPMNRAERRAAGQRGKRTT